MKLLKILKEISVVDDDMRGFDIAEDVHEYVSDYGSFAGRIFAKYVPTYRKYNTERWYPKDIEAFLKMFPQVASLSDKVIVVRGQRGPANIFLAVNFNVPINESFVGFVSCYEVEDSYAYSEKKQFAIDLIGKVELSAVVTEYRGKGLGKLLYDTAFTFYGGLMSDATLYKGSANMWLKHLSKKASPVCAILNTSPKMLVPLTLHDVDDMNSSYLINRFSGFIFFDKSKPATLPVRKLAYNVKGLSITKGEYTVVNLYTIKIDDKSLNFEESVEQADNLIALMKHIYKVGDDRGGGYASVSPVYPDTIINPNCKAVVINFINATVVIKDNGGHLTYTLI